MKTLLQRINSKLVLAIVCVIGLKQNSVAQAAAIIQDINIGAPNSSPTLFTNCGGLNVIFFVADNGTTGSELWKYDIATSTATLVKDINPGPAGSGITAITANFAGNGIIFNANDGTNGNELWKSDGTAAGTSLVIDINAGAGSSNPANFYPYGGTFICSADDGTNGKEPWLTGGTAGSTAMLKDINPGIGSSDPNSFSALGGKVIFRANDGSVGSELWSTDMTSGGTVLLKDINTGTLSSVPLNLTVVSNTLFFSASNTANGSELWKSDGTTIGTVLVKDINVGSSGSINNGPGAKGFFTAYNNALYFQATDGASGYELWKSDGTSAGTTLVKDIQTGAGSSTPSGMFATTVNLFFVANDGINGMELWTSDGTTGGTSLVKDINSGAASSTSSITTFIRTGSGIVYFAANDGVNGTEFWRTLGSAGNTTMMADINSGAGSSSPANMLINSNNVYFSATDGTTGVEPWKFDPLAAGINEVGKEEISFSVFPNPCKDQLNFKSDEERLTIRIYSVLGNLVYINAYTRSDSKNLSIDLSEFSSGVYFVKATAGQRETVRKIILSQ